MKKLLALTISFTVSMLAASTTWAQQSMIESFEISSFSCVNGNFLKEDDSLKTMDSSKITYSVEKKGDVLTLSRTTSITGDSKLVETFSLVGKVTRANKTSYLATSSRLADSFFVEFNSDGLLETLFLRDVSQIHCGASTASSNTSVNPQYGVDLVAINLKAQALAN